MNVQFHIDSFYAYHVPLMEKINILNYCEGDSEDLDIYWILITEDLFKQINFSEAGLNWLCNITWEEACKVTTLQFTH